MLSISCYMPLHSSDFYNPKQQEHCFHHEKIYPALDGISLDTWGQFLTYLDPLIPWLGVLITIQQNQEGLLSFRPLQTLSRQRN